MQQPRTLPGEVELEPDLGGRSRLAEFMHQHQRFRHERVGDQHPAPAQHEPDFGDIGWIDHGEPDTVAVQPDSDQVEALVGGQEQFAGLGRHEPCSRQRLQPAVGGDQLGCGDRLDPLQHVDRRVEHHRALRVAQEVGDEPGGDVLVKAGRAASAARPGSLPSASAQRYQGATIRQSWPCRSTRWSRSATTPTDWTPSVVTRRSLRRVCTWAR